ncbi:extracellular solute-binding protein [Nonomuraea sp. SBT364]|uniref:extracellular solute-binding protein n=1 Tax=Nonomuraea sp. SBT364 TaxID=1580530 RepID=UPI00066C530C|nr:extracellular solute-binding protein [Nonomuraea sp. SBT364]
MRSEELRPFAVLFACALAVALAMRLFWPTGGAPPQAKPTPPVSPVPVPSTPPADCGDEADLIVATGDDISTGSVRREVFDDWNRYQKPPGHPRAKLLELSGSTDVRRAQMAALAQAGSCQYHVLVLDLAWVAEFARHGYLRPIDLTDPGKFLPGPLRAAQIDGEQYGVPFAADAPLEYRRTDVPSGGYLLQLNDKEMGTINFLETIEFGGGRVLDGDDRTGVALDDDSWESLRSPTRTAFGTDTDVTVLRESLHLDEDQSVAAFKDGRVGVRPVSYMRNWPIAFHQLAADPRMRGADGKLRFEVRAPETSGGVLGGSVLAISKHIPADKLQPAMRLIEQLTGDQVQSHLFACGGYGPVLTAIYDDFRSGRGAPCRHEGSSEIIAPSAQELATLAVETRESVELAEPRPKSPYYAQFSEAFRRCARGAWEEQVVQDTFLSSTDMLKAALDGKVPDGSPTC